MRNNFSLNLVIRSAFLMFTITMQVNMETAFNLAGMEIDTPIHSILETDMGCYGMTRLRRINEIANQTNVM